MDYIYPNKNLLENRSEELGKEEKYYSLSKLIYEKDFNDKLLFPVGIDNNNEKYYINLLEKSGMFISGETGSGKSIFINDIVISLLLKNTPEELQIVFIDPRNVEFNVYRGVPHVQNNVFSNKEDSVNALKKMINTIEERRELFVNSNNKNIGDYNSKEKEKLPQILLIIDESSDIVEYMETKDYINRILSEGYKFGIHLILATSSYLKNSFDQETLDKFNYILSFDLASEEQAKYLKMKRANLLSISGEALIKLEGDSIINIQVPYVSDCDIEVIVNYLKNTSN